jgi:hypothetical protein
MKDEREGIDSRIIALRNSKDDFNLQEKDESYINMNFTLSQRNIEILLGFFAEHLQLKFQSSAEEKIKGESWAKSIRKLKDDHVNNIYLVAPSLLSTKITETQVATISMDVSMLQKSKAGGNTPEISPKGGKKVLLEEVKETTATNFLYGPRGFYEFISDLFSEEKSKECTRVVQLTIKNFLKESQISKDHIKCKSKESSILFEHSFLTFNYIPNSQFYLYRAFYYQQTHCPNCTILKVLLTICL